MPCIITTTEGREAYEHRRAADSGAYRNQGIASRAVATLEEDELKRRLFNWREGDELDSREALLLDAIVTAQLPEDGGTIALPDGTVIEVTAIGWEAFAELVDEPVFGDDQNAALIDAYNARQTAA